ncbi:MAG: hypothetical protein JWL87_751 [Candidatus Adlerbacteria bacterium]|nr:hypothetical protein [Candidatus Adlerbacteria bacterium]
MVTFFSAMLGISILGMASLLWLKRYELNSGRVFLGSARPAVGEFFHRKLQWLEYVLPGLIRAGLQDFYRTLRRLMHVGLAWVALRVEQGLERALRGVRHATALPKRRGEETSAFLRQVAEHKKKLQEDLPDRGTVLEE